MLGPSHHTSSTSSPSKTMLGRYIYLTSFKITFLLWNMGIILPILRAFDVKSENICNASFNSVVTNPCLQGTVNLWRRNRQWANKNQSQWILETVWPFICLDLQHRPSSAYGVLPVIRRYKHTWECGSSQNEKSQIIYKVPFSWPHQRAEVTQQQRELESKE